MPKPKATAAPSLPAAPQIDNPGGAGGYALQPTQNAVTAAQNADPSAAPSYLTDPGYQGALNSQTQGNADINTLLGNGLSNLFIQFGSPALASQLAQYGYSLTPNDAAAAQTNYNAGTATQAQLDQAHTTGVRTAINALAAHGIADSGDLGYQVGQQDQSYANNSYNALQGVLGQAYQLQENALTQKQALQAAVNTALSGAWTNFTNNPAAYTQPQPAAPTGYATPAATTVAAAPAAKKTTTVAAKPSNESITAAAIAAQGGLGKKALR